MRKHDQGTVRRGPCLLPCSTAARSGLARNSFIQRDVHMQDMRFTKRITPLLAMAMLLGCGESADKQVAKADAVSEEAAAAPAEASPAVAASNGGSAACLDVPALRTVGNTWTITTDGQRRQYGCRAGRLSWAECLSHSYREQRGNGGGRLRQCRRWRRPLVWKCDDPAGHQ